MIHLQFEEIWKLILLFWKIGKKSNLSKIFEKLEADKWMEPEIYMNLAELKWHSNTPEPLLWKKMTWNVHTWLNSECPTSTTRRFARTAEILSHMTSTNSTWETFMPMPMIPVTGIGDDEKFTLIGRDPIKSTQGLSLSMIRPERYINVNLMRLERVEWFNMIITW